MVGKKPLAIPEGVDVHVDKGSSTAARVIRVVGPKGELSVNLPQGVGVDVKEREVFFKKLPGTAAAIFGLAYALARNAVEGVSQGFSKELELMGVGYRVAKTAAGLKMSLGFSHSVEFDVPEGVMVEVEGDTKIRLSGIDKRLVTQTAADIRKLRPPEPYKGKGIRYVGEVVRRKPGKAAKTAGGLGQG
ncbi:MAG: 50S ribosomal protein L6 [Patescibacteria group bacterium]|nr:MAG: 50S ribosomal protein L6 [Patescibacteria group bacterium]